MKSAPTYQKLRGGYYTPKPIADFLARWAIRSSATEVLEPSCGDGGLLGAAVDALSGFGADKKKIAGLVHGVEIDPGEAAKSAERLRSLGVDASSAQIHVGDFFSHCKAQLIEHRLFDTIVAEGRHFDAVIGNPPFIRYQNFPEEHRTVALELMRGIGLKPNKLTNAWVPFLVASTLLLKERGRIAMIVPAELLQVNYAAELRLFLSEYYSRLTLVTFKSLVFAGIQQEVVLLLGERGGEERTGVRTIELDDLKDLERLESLDVFSGELKPMNHSTEKWTQYFLTWEEIELLRTLKVHPELTTAGDVIDVDVGIVTGLNKFFVLTEQQVTEYGLRPYCRSIVGRSGKLKGAVFSVADWNTTVDEQFPAFLFSPPNVTYEVLPEAVKRYVAKGEQGGLNQGYKCRIRKRWYVVPSVWVPEAFMLRQVHNFPKIVLNDSNTTCTDTIHRVRFLNGANKENVTAAFLNSLTFAFSEVIGRSYGGGVLELEPNEAERLPLPLRNADALDLKRTHKLLLNNEIDAILDAQDRALLIDGLGLSIEEVGLLRGIWRKLRDRRVNRKYKR